jgi:hypothetical protein
MNKIAKVIFSTLLISFFAGCIASNLTFGNGDKWIPADFDPQKTVLLIERSETMTAEEKDMDEYMKKTYPYRYEFVTIDKIRNTSEKYPNDTEFRYALVNYLYHLNTSKGPVGVEDFNFYDRMNAKSYPNSEKGSYKKIVTFKPLINTIVSRYKK